MRKILIIGAGRSAGDLVNYLLSKAESEQLFLTIADISLENAQKFTQNQIHAAPLALDIFNQEERQNAVQEADLSLIHI